VLIKIPKFILLLYCDSILQNHNDQILSMSFLSIYIYLKKVMYMLLYGAFLILYLLAMLVYELC